MESAAGFAVSLSTTLKTHLRQHYSKPVELTWITKSSPACILVQLESGQVLAADMTRHEEIFAAVGAVKGMKLRGTSNEWLANAWKWAEWEGKQAVAALHSVLMGFLPRP